MKERERENYQWKKEKTINKRKVKSTALINQQWKELKEENFNPFILYWNKQLINHISFKTAH